MAAPVPKHSFTVGEVSPSMMGRQDVDRYAASCGTARNFFVSYTGPLYSRAGTRFVGYSKQTGRNYPPRLIDFQFATSQGLAMEFGHQYVRFISNAAYVTETPIAITFIQNTSPVEIALANVFAISGATPVNSGVVAPYAPGDTITLAGGSYQTAAVLTVAQTLVKSVYVSTPGTTYIPGQTITTTGGTHTTAAVLTVAATQVVSATIVSAGSGGTNGTQTVTGTTGVGTFFQASVTVASGAITAINSITLGGAYTTNPTTLTSEPVTGGGLTGAVLSVVMGVQAATVSTAGLYSANPTSNLLTQGSTSGSGTGATFNGVFAPYSATVLTPGSYISLPANPAAQASSSGAGVGAQFNLSSVPVPPQVFVGDWLYVSGIAGTTQLNNETYVIGGVAGNVVTLNDVYGTAVDATTFGAYIGGGFVARVYTLTTPYNEQDLPWLKVEQSADTMSICCLNPNTSTEYAPQDLVRASDTSWSFNPVIPAPSVTPPTAVSGTASGGGSVNFEYVVTSIDPTDGTESVASAAATITNAVDISSTAGSITVSWKGVAGVNEYYVYKALPGYNAPVQPGAQFGYAGYTYGASFVDSNITPDFSQAPPTHKNPFARGAITGATPVAPGSGYTKISLSIVSATGSGGALTGVLNPAGGLAAIIVNEEGSGYMTGDGITISGNGTGAAATLQIGPQSGTYPSLVAYFQERRGYANSLNNPDTYWFSKPGAFTNFDVRNPTVANDAITGAPWAVQVDGVQWMIQTSGGLLVMTGLRAWMLVGSGSFATNVQPLSPSNQNDVPQAFSGCSPLVQPILVNYDVIYADRNSAYYYDLPYQLYTLSEPIDLTDVSAHMFDGYTIVASCHCEKPYRLIWSIRSDGILLGLTYYKTQKVQGWTRHDTQGLFVGCCTVIEPPVNAAYFATQRFIGSNTAYMIERMDNRIWRDVEDVWAVDCALAYPQPTPAASLTISSAIGIGALTGATGIIGGSGYSSAAYGVVTDGFSGPGAGAVPTLTFTGGGLTGVSFAAGSQGAGYTQPQLTIIDPAGSVGGSGASATLTLANTVILASSVGVFAPSSVGSVVRAAGGVMQITGYTDALHVTANMLSPCTNVIPGTGGHVPVIPAGSWTMTAPTSTVTGLRHLAGMTVTGLADGNVIPPTVVSVTGTISLPAPASAIVVGLGFQAQFQDVPIEVPGGGSSQGARKKLTATTLRVDKSRGLKIGTNQTNGSSLSPPQVEVAWSGLVTVPDDGPSSTFPPKPYNALCTPLRTGDVRTAAPGQPATPGTLCVQQDLPLPANIVAIYSELLPGDTPQMQAPPRQQKK